MDLESLLLLLIYLLPILAIGAFMRHRKHKKKQQVIELLEKNKQMGLMEPASLHPSIDANLCIACNSCIHACPEHDVIGLIDSKAVLVNPTHCIGHGACAAACPLDAITLVFGTEKRGLDIPNVNKNFETNVPGVFIVGELGGMGLIRNAMEQGKQGIDSVRKKSGLGQGDSYDIVIIGAGPAGISASLCAKNERLKYVTLEQESLGGTVSHYPRGKIVMTQPLQLPLVGKIKFRETSKEKLLELWQDIVHKYQLNIHYQERFEAILSRENGLFHIKTNKQQYHTKNIMLAIGRRGTPRKLGAKGEDLNKVVYRLIDASQYAGQKVLVVGGGDSALEAATTIADEQGTEVILSYRSNAFSRAKEKNRLRVEHAAAQGKLQVLYASQVQEITPEKVIIAHEDTIKTFANDAVIISAGGILPTKMLQEMGIQIDTKFGTA